MIGWLFSASTPPVHGPRDLTPILLPSLILVAIILVAWGVLVAVRRKLRAAAGRTGGAFTLQELRQLRDQGTLSEEEFERARASLIGLDNGSGPTKSP